MSPVSNTPPRRVLVLTAGFGEGHNAAARAVAAAADRLSGPGSALIADAFALSAPRTNAIARSIYLRLINDAPRLWSRFYDWIGDSEFAQRQLWFFRSEIRVLTELLARERPAAICCTYPLYPFFLAQIAREWRGFVPPIFNVVTDSISIHPLWWRAPCNGWFLPNEDSAAVIRNAGIEGSAVHVSGFPVPAFFSENAGSLFPQNLSRGAKPAVLHLINSGTRHAETTARRLLNETDWSITCAVGRDQVLERRLLEVARRREHPTQILGWTDRIPELLMTHHVVVSKAGGATTQESIAALCPLIVSQIVPGQEEGNYELLRRHGAGAYAPTPDAVLMELRRAFANGGEIWGKWRSALQPLAFPQAADAIARHLLGAGHASRVQAPLRPGSSGAVPPLVPSSVRP